MLEYLSVKRYSPLSVYGQLYTKGSEQQWQEGPGHHRDLTNTNHIMKLSIIYNIPTTVLFYQMNTPISVILGIAFNLNTY